MKIGEIEINLGEMVGPTRYITRQSISGEMPVGEIGTALPSTKQALIGPSSRIVGLHLVMGT